MGVPLRLAFRSFRRDTPWTALRACTFPLAFRIFGSDYPHMLSRSSTYALRALTFMAASTPGGWLLNRQIAAEVALPPQFLTKILSILAAEGILESQRGRTGGFRLARPASRISLLEVVEPFDHLSSGEVCLLGQAACSDECPCPLHWEWKRISRSLSRLLRRTTLAQLASSIRSDGFPGPIPRTILQALERSAGAGSGRRKGA